MKPGLYFIHAVFLLLLVSGCANKERLEQILFEAMPRGSQANITETCTPFMGPAVAVLSDVNLPDREHIGAQGNGGLWVRAQSLTEFASQDKYEGPGIAATILDGKNCLKKVYDDAEIMLFGENEGWYFRSANRNIVIAVFDDVRIGGVLFAQAP